MISHLNTQKARGIIRPKICTSGVQLSSQLGEIWHVWKEHSGKCVFACFYGWEGNNPAFLEVGTWRSPKAGMFWRHTDNEQESENVKSHLKLLSDVYRLFSANQLPVVIPRGELVEAHPAILYCRFVWPSSWETSD